MATIGSIIIGMRVGTTQLAKGLQTARGMLSSFSSTISSTQAAFGALASVLGTSVSVYALASLTQQSMEAIDSTTKLADRIGTTTESLIGLQHAADLSGTSSDELQSALEKMSTNLGKAKSGAAGAKEAFESLGLNVDELASGDPVEAVKQIADGINQLPTASDRAAASMEIFGKQGIGLLNTLAGGSEGIDAMTADAEKLGLTFSRVDAAQVEAANDALSRAWKLVTGLGNQLAVQLAPFIEVAANKLTDMATNGIDMGQIVSTAIEWVVGGIGLLADIVHTVKLGFLALRAVVNTVLYGIAEGIASLSEGLEALINLLPGVKVSFTETLRAIADDMKKLKDNEWAGLNEALMEEPPSTGIKSFFDDVKRQAKSAAEEITKAGESVQTMGNDFTEAAEKVGELEEKLRLQIATFGMSSTEADIYKLKQEGVSEAMLANVQALGTQLKEMERKKEIEDELASSAKQVIEANKTPLEKFQLEIEKLQTLRDKGLIDTTTFERATAKAKSDLGTEPTNKKVEFAGAFELGSNEARQAILQNRFGSSNKDPMNKVESNTKMLVDKETEAIGVLKQILAKTGGEEVFDF